MKKTPLMISLLALFILVISATSCKKDDAPGTPAPSTNARKIKYEITGPYINKLLLAFTEISGGLESVTTSLPWTKEITYSSSVAGIGIGGNSQIPAVSSDAGKVITIKIYSDGKLVKTSTATADANGIINFPTITYIF